jgi:hypothetical protein
LVDHSQWSVTVGHNRAELVEAVSGEGRAGVIPSKRRQSSKDLEVSPNIFAIAAAMDLIYQLLVLHGLRPVQTLAAAIALAIIPYVVLRGPVNRLAKLTITKSGSDSCRAA